MPAPAPVGDHEGRRGVLRADPGRTDLAGTRAAGSRLRLSGVAMPESCQMAGTLYLGTSGFSYDQWKHGVFYPEGLKNREMLSYYASRFPSVEINYTFRRYPTQKSLETWKAETPEGFRFTLKANQRITHWKRLADVDQDVRDFLELGRLLGDRLGTVLTSAHPRSRTTVP